MHVDVCSQRFAGDSDQCTIGWRSTTSCDICSKKDMSCGEENHLADIHDSAYRMMMKNKRYFGSLETSSTGINCS